MLARRLIWALFATTLLLGSCASDTADEPAATPTESAATEQAAARGSAVDVADLVAAVQRLIEVPHRAESFWDFGDGDDGMDPDSPISGYDFDGT